jgi:hypothetical protein
MAHSKKPTDRKPATKFSHLSKKMDRSKLRGNVKKGSVHKTSHK